jgi:DNA repair exonuclease SbcCD nuclease subunit
LKLLHCSDWHGDKSTMGVPRYNDVARAVSQTVQTAHDERVDVYVCTGDIADPDDGPNALQNLELACATAAALASDGIASIWVPGNHDVIENGSGRSLLSPIAWINPSMVRLCDRPSMQLIGPRKETKSNRFYQGVYLIALPYVPLSAAYDPPSVVREFARQLESRPHDRVIVATHLMFTGAQIGDETTEMPRGRDVEFPWEECDPSWLILGGHYHRRQVVEGPGGRRAHIAGSLARLTRGEANNVPAFSLIEV